MLLCACNLTTCRFVGVPCGDYRRSKADSVRASSTGFVVPRARLGAMGPQPRRPEVGGDSISRLHRVRQLHCGNWRWVVAPRGPRGLASGSLHYFPCALSPGQGDLYWRVAGCIGSLSTALFIYTERSEGVPLHLGIGHHDVPLYAP